LILGKDLRSSLLPDLERLALRAEEAERVDASA
jgi:hypothetical protein